MKKIFLLLLFIYIVVKLNAQSVASSDLFKPLPTQTQTSEPPASISSDLRWE